MIRKKIDSALVRQFLTAMVISKPFLVSVVPIMDTALLDAKYAIKVADWCVKYFNAYGEAPNKNITELYHSWVENDKPEETDANAVYDFLNNLSQDSLNNGMDLNVPFLLDEVSTYLTMKKVERLRGHLDDCLMEGKKIEALDAITKFNSIDFSAGVGFNPLRDKSAWDRAFAQAATPVIQMPGDAGRFFDYALTRDSLIGVQGPEKRGKTFVCMDFVYWALRTHSRVAMFQVGDLSESQLMKRLAVRIAGVPMWPNQCQKGILVPKSITVVEDADGKKKADVDYDHKTFPSPIDRNTAVAARRKFCLNMGIPHDEDRVMFSIHANSSINVKGIHAILNRWRHERNFVPDVIIVDYADILSPETFQRESRDVFNDTWKALRRLSQEWHACVIAPTQANTAAYKKETMDMSNFSGDKRKNAHVTGMFGLNQTSEEKKQGVIRYNWTILRESEYNVGDCLWVAQCLPLGIALAKSTLG